MVLWEAFLPVEREESESTYKWSNGLRCSLQTLSEGPAVSDVSNGETLADCLLQVAQPGTHPDAASGVDYHFDEAVESAEARIFFGRTLPKMADLALRLMALLVEQVAMSERMAEEVKNSGDDDKVVFPSPLKVDFANKFVGGGVLRSGCVQEEIRFVLSSELLAGMFFLPAMAENEAVEITGSERFSSYAGYGGKFHYAGDFVDSTPRDAWGRRCTKIIAMDAKARPGEAQFGQKLLLREVNREHIKELRLGIGDVGRSEGIFPSRAC